MSGPEAVGASKEPAEICAPARRILVSAPGGFLLRHRWACYCMMQGAAETMRVSQTYTAVVKQSGAWWIGWIEEVPGVNCQERTREELLETLRITL
jgi:hypothetical protein